MNSEQNAAPPPQPRKTKGRRSGSEKRERGMVNTFRSTRAERIQADTDAAAIGLTFGSYIRWLLFEHPQTRPTRRALPDEMLLRQIKAQAGHARGELSQLVKKVNYGAIVRPDHLDAAIRAIEDFYAYALQALKDAR